jgi:hypothetical protein
MLFVVVLAALALSLYFAVRPVYAGGVATLQESQQGTDSSEAQDNCEGEDSVPAGEVLWHFILNGLDPGITSAISGHFEFDNAGTLNVDSSKWNPGGDTHHFYVFTTGDDTLLDATADIGDSDYNNFVLSHICHGEEEQESASAEQSVAESEAESEAASGEQSEKAGEGTPEGSQGDTSLLFNGSGPLATIAFSLILLASLGTLAYANVKSVRSRNQ